jgi:predicted nucleic acid-binding protein
MPYLLDTDVLVDLSRNNRAAVAYVDHLSNDWALSAITAREFISGAKNQREVELIDRLLEIYELLPVNDAIGRRAYDLLKTYAKSQALRDDRGIGDRFPPILGDRAQSHAGQTA